MSRAIEWFARNSVAANLLMVLIMGSGIFLIFSIRLEILPEVSSGWISISMVYRGAAPAEVEEAICVRIEEAVQDLDGIKRITSTASENMGIVKIAVESGTDLRTLLDDVKVRVDAITTFPAETEKPIVQEITKRPQVISIAISGPTDKKTLKILGEQVRDDIARISGITQVKIRNARPYEIAIEVSENDLRRYGLTFDEIAQAIRKSSIDLPSGTIRSQDGEILLRTAGQAYRGTEFESLVLRTLPDGTRLRLDDVATVIDGFAEIDQSAQFDGEPAVMVQVYRVGDQNALEIAEKVKAYVDEAQAQMPDGIKLTVWKDFSRSLNDRLSLMLENGRIGLILVFISLAIFLHLRLAFWVTLGIPISFLGAISMMSFLGISINMVSLFTFIVVLGIVVDDAVIIGENIYRHYQMGKSGLRAAIDGACEVSVPVIFAILTSIAAFAPLLTIESALGELMKIIPQVVILVLIFSLIESLFILPAHLASVKLEVKKSINSRRKRAIVNLWQRLQDGVSNGLLFAVDRYYRPFLEWALQWRYLTLASGVAVFLLTASLVGGGWIKFVLFSDVDADRVVALLTMPRGTPVEVTEKAVRRIEQSAYQLQREMESNDSDAVLSHILASVGEQPYRIEQNQAWSLGSRDPFSSAHLGEVSIELVFSEDRNIDTAEIVKRWRELTGSIPDVVELTYEYSLIPTGKAIDIQLFGSDYDELREVAEKIKNALDDYPGVFSIADSFRPGKEEVKLSLTQQAENLGITLADLARQVRQAFYGEEVQRIQRGRDDIRVMVRYPESERRSLVNLEDMRIRTPNGGEVPFSIAAKAELDRGYASIYRTDRQKVINVTADVDQRIANTNEIVADVTRTVLPQILADHPRVRYSFEGEQKRQVEILQSMVDSIIIALLIIYILLAIPFKSYTQPLIVMGAIPFGIIGAVWGHVVLGFDLSTFSALGIVALTGIVVNDSLVMVNFINKQREQGRALSEAIREAGAVRFRPILLTSLTTFFGLSPLIVEKSLQAQFLTPMAISLGFGVLFATVITLLFVPVSYNILEDLINAFYRLIGRERRAFRADVSHAPAHSEEKYGRS